MYLNSPSPRSSGSAQNKKGAESVMKPSGIDSSEYLTAGSLLRGDRAICLPVSAGLPSAGGTFKDTPTSRPTTMRSSRTLPLAATSNLALPIRKQASYIPPVPSAELHRPNRELLKTVSISSMTESTTSIIDAKSSTSVSKRSSVTTPPSKIKKPSESFFLLSSKPITDEDVIQYNLLNKRATESVRNNKSTKSNGFQNLKSSKLDFFDTDSIGESITSYDRQSTGSKGVAMKRSTGSSNGVSDDWMRNMAQMSSRIKSKLTEAPVRSSREEIAFQIQASMETERRAKEIERKTYLQRRAEIVCLNHIMRVVEQAKFEKQRRKDLDGGTETAKEAKLLKTELANILMKGTQKGKSQSVLEDMMMNLDLSHSV